MRNKTSPVPPGTSQSYDAGTLRSLIIISGDSLSGHVLPLGGWFHCSTNAKLKLPKRLLQTSGFIDVVVRGKNNGRAFNFNHLEET